LTDPSLGPAGLAPFRAADGQPDAAPKRPLLARAREDTDFDPEVSDVAPPDITEAPDLGPAVDSRDLLGGSFDNSMFAQMAFAQDTGVVIGWSHLPGDSGRQDGAPPVGAAAVAAFDIASGALKWQVDLAEAAARRGLGLSLFTCCAPSQLSGGKGNVLVGFGRVLFTVSSDGQVVSAGEVRREVEHEPYHHPCQRGVIIVTEWEDTPSVGRRHTAYSATDLQTPLWSRLDWATGPIGDCSVIHQPSGTFWVRTKDGFVDAPSGQAIEWLDPPRADGGHVAAPCCDELALFHEDGYDLARIDPATGATLWRADGRNVTALEIGWADIVRALGSHTSGFPFRTVEAIRLADGKTKWRRRLPKPTIVRLTEHTAFVHVAGGALIGLDLGDGRRLFRVKHLTRQDRGAWFSWGSEVFAFARRTMYFVDRWDGGETAWLRAFSTTDGTRLWELGIPIPDAAVTRRHHPGAWLHTDGSRLLAHFQCALGAATYEVMHIVHSAQSQANTNATRTSPSGRRRHKARLRLVSERKKSR
jgi:outer membrane protein assembly factor BamB